MRIHLPAETWAEIFAWLNRREFAKKMEQLWDREFSPIAEKWLHEWSRNIKIGSLELKINENTKQAELWKYDRGYWYYDDKQHHVPIAEVDMPKNICSFKEIRIYYLDNTVIAFLRKMQPLLRNIHLSLDSLYGCECQIAFDHLRPLFSGEFESVGLGHNGVPLLNDNRYISTLMDTKLLDMKHDVSFDFELVANWLFSRRADGQPRMLVLPYLSCYNYYKTFTAIVQERFMAPTEAFPFIIRFRFNQVSSRSFLYEPFEGRTFKNVKNGQQLIVREIEDHRWDMPEKYILYISCPMDVNPEHLAEWEQEMLDSGSIDVERDFRMFLPRLGPFDPVDDPQPQQPTSSSAEVSTINVEQTPGTSSKAMKRNAHVLEEEKMEAECGGNEKKRARID